MKKLLPLVCLVSRGGTPLQEPNGDVLLDGVAFLIELLEWVANFRILGVTRESKWEDSRLKRSESCLLNLTISLHGPAF